MRGQFPPLQTVLPVRTLDHSVPHRQRLSVSPAACTLLLAGPPPACAAIPARSDGGAITGRCVSAATAGGDLASLTRASPGTQDGVDRDAARHAVG